MSLKRNELSVECNARRNAIGRQTRPLSNRRCASKHSCAGPERELGLVVGGGIAEKPDEADGCFAARRACDPQCAPGGPRRDHRRDGARLGVKRDYLSAHMRSDVSRAGYCPRTPDRASMSTRVDTDAPSLSFPRTCRTTGSASAQSSDSTPRSPAALHPKRCTSDRPKTADRDQRVFGARLSGNSGLCKPGAQKRLSTRAVFAEEFRTTKTTNMQLYQ